MVIEWYCQELPTWVDIIKDCSVVNAWADMDDVIFTLLKIPKRNVMSSFLQKYLYCISSNFSDLPDMKNEHSDLSVFE